MRLEHSEREREKEMRMERWVGLGHLYLGGCGKEFGVLFYYLVGYHLMGLRSRDPFFFSLDRGTTSKLWKEVFSSWSRRKRKWMRMSGHHHPPRPLFPLYPRTFFMRCISKCLTFWCYLGPWPFSRLIFQSSNDFMNFKITMTNFFYIKLTRLCYNQETQTETRR